MTDTKGGVVWDAPAMQFLNGGVQPLMGVASNPIPLVSGTWATVNKPTILMLAAKVNIIAPEITTRLALGDINNTLGYALPAGFGLSNSGSFHAAVGTNGVATRSEEGAPLDPTTQTIFGATSYASRPALTISQQSNAQVTPTYGSGAMVTAIMSVEPAGTGTIIGLNWTALGNGYRANSGGSTLYVLDPAQASVASLEAKSTDAYMTSAITQDVVVYAKYTPTTTLEYFCRNVNSGEIYHSIDFYTATAAPASVTPNPCMRISGYNLFGVAMMQFTAFPTGIDTDIFWQGAQWLKNNKHISPRLIGVS